MREYAGSSDLAPPVSGSLTDVVVRNAREHPERIVLARRAPAAGPDSDPEWVDVSAAAFLDEVRRTAKGFVAAGVRPGDRVVLLSRTRHEWTVLDYALWFCGAVSVPVYESSSSDQLRWIVEDSGAHAGVVDTPERARALREAAPGLDSLWVIDDDAGHRALEELDQGGAAVLDADLEAVRGAVTPADVATIIYTSGTTGQPKGCALTHGNFMVELEATITELPELFDAEDAATLLVLPMAHVFARIIQIGAVTAGVRLGHAADIRRLLPDLRSFQPTFVLGVPRVFEKIFTAASQEAAAAGRSRVFDRATDVAIASSEALDRGRVGPFLRGQRAVFERLMFATLRETLGGRCEYAVSGGAPLGERLTHFYRGIGIPVLEGYGLTETSGAVTVNTPSALRVGTVGRPLPGTTVRVAEDGELQVRGGQVMQGYWHDEEGTAQVLTPDGWLRTGDLAEIDDEGFVRITGRMTEILVTTGGKNVAPGMLEERLRAHPLVDHCLVVGDGRPYVGALVTLDPDVLREWAARHHKRGSRASLLDDPELRAEVQGAVDEANKTVSQAEAIRRFEILPAQWSEETGELTPSLKVRRAVVTRRHRADVERMYRA